MELDEHSSHYLQQMHGCKLKQIMRFLNKAALLFSNEDESQNWVVAISLETRELVHIERLPTIEETVYLKWYNDGESQKYLSKQFKMRYMLVTDFWNRKYENSATFTVF